MLNCGHTLYHGGDVDRTLRQFCFTSARVVMAGDVEANCLEKAGVASLKALPESSGRLTKKDMLVTVCEEGGCSQLAASMPTPQRLNVPSAIGSKSSRRVEQRRKHSE